ncbi:hypothetical protein [Paenibacillus tyrfis]|uniref:hypothetical protein n=1 Tax=Paenibacillus tyrfis TaxID=1501230 RepID=UPI00209CB494|nr:hypothetical protein [Paenibacillus tyrfis]MCP1312087.1 hypothetical protein [Paenibacillus tyrfis]
MTKLYSDPKLPDVKKWSVYVPKDRIYKKMKQLSIEHDEHINNMVIEAFEIYIKIFPDISVLRKEAEALQIPLDEYIKHIISNRQQEQQD